MMNYRVAAIAAFLVAVGGRGMAQDPTRPTQPQVVTSGQGEVRVAPDRATVSVGVQTRALTAAEASATNARRQKAVIDAVKGKGVLVDMITTTGFNVQPEFKYEKAGAPPTIAGYLVSNTVVVELQRVDLTGAVIDAAIGAGANQVNSLAFFIANPDSARRVALAIAVGRAKGDAEVAARAAGGMLGGIIELTATDNEVPMPRPVMYRMQAAEAGTPVEAGQQSVRASVVVRWKFVPSAP